MIETANCGIVALEEIKPVKSVSMFTLLHMARDNGINLYFCKIDQNQMMDVVRPAIFHQRDHFVTVKDGEVFPEGEYDGYVLTPKPINEPLPFSLAKKITGKGSSAKKLIGPIVTGVASVINPFLGAAVGAGFGYKAYKDSGSKEWWRIPLGAATGYLQGIPGGSTFGIGNAALAGGLAAAGEVPGAIKTGNWLAPVTAGLGQYAGANLIGGIQQGVSSAAPGLLSKIGGGVQGGVDFIKGGVQSLAGGGQAPGGGGIESASTALGSSSASTPAGYSGTYGIPGIGNKVVGLPGGVTPAGFTAENAASLAASGFTQPATAAGSGTSAFSDVFKKLLPGGTSGSNPLKWLGAAASTAIQPPQLQTNTPENYSKAAEYLGIDQYKALPQATRTQLEEYVNTPLDQLAQKFYTPDDKGIRRLEEAKQQAIDSLQTQFANYGQDPYTSSDAQKRLNDVTTQYDQAIAEYEQQLQNQAMQQAIGFKKDMLSKAMEQGSFDYESAMDLATHIGKDQEMRYAMETKNYDALQSILAEIFSLGGNNDLLKTY